MIGVVIADDHAVVRRGLKLRLGSRAELCAMRSITT